MRPRDRRTRPGKLSEPAATKSQRPAESEPAPFSITLRDIEIPPPPRDPRPQGPDEELVRSDPEARAEPWLGDPDAERAAQRTARRAQVRKDRLRDAMPEADFPPTENQAVGLHPLPHTVPVPALPAMPAAVDATLASEAPPPQVVPPVPTVRPAGAVPTLRDALPPAGDVPPVGTVRPAKVVPQASAAQRVADAPAAIPAPLPAVSAPVADAGPAAPAILVLRAIGDGPDPLCDQLKAFGFNVELRRAPPDLPAPWPFVAVFIDHALRIDDGGDAIDLCNEVRERSRLPGVLKPVLVLVADQLSATNRVRAGLAGCNEIVLGAITRGSVAKVLDTRGIALPSDARRV
jgi:hypothetical protein